MIRVEDVFRTFKEKRGDSIVIPTGTSGRHWGDYTDNDKRDMNLGGPIIQTT